MLNTPKNNTKMQNMNAKATPNLAAFQCPYLLTRAETERRAGFAVARSCCSRSLECAGAPALPVKKAALTCKHDCGTLKQYPHYPPQRPPQT